MMNAILINSKQNKFDKVIEKFMNCHPYAAFLLLFISIPIFMLIAVFACTTVVVLPISWIMGWI